MHINCTKIGIYWGFFLLFSSSKWLWQVMHNSNTSNETSKITNLWNITSYFKELIIVCKENCQIITFWHSSASKADYTILNIFHWKKTWLCTLCPEFSIPLIYFYKISFIHIFYILYIIRCMALQYLLFPILSMDHLEKMHGYYPEFYAIFTETLRYTFFSQKENKIHSL